MPETLEHRSLQQRWEEYQLTKVQTFWIAIAAVAATLVLGFGFGGWVTGGTAQEMVTKAADEARTELATAVCLNRFMAAADVKTRLAKIKNATWYERDELVSAGGWATMPDTKEPDMTVAGTCAEKLAEMDAVKDAGA